MNLKNCIVSIEPRHDGYAPAIFIKDNNNVYMVTITPDHNFDITDETNCWDIVNGKGKYIKK